MILFLLLFTTCCAMDNNSRDRRESLDLRRSSYAVAIPEHRFICLQCNDRYYKDKLVIASCGHACCRYCYEQKAFVYCKFCKGLLRDSDFYSQLDNE